MKSLIVFLQVVLQDLEDRCGTSTARDFKTITSRIEHEGLSFLTITLTDFARDFERSLELGRVAPSCFESFSRHRGLPRFLGGFLEQVFDRCTGQLLDDPSHQAILAIRQITLMFGKIALPCSPRRVKAAIDGYVKCEQDVERSVTLFLSERDRLERFQRVGLLLWADLFSRVDSRIYNESITPRHGPGATADKLRGNAKYNNLSWTSRLESVFPHWEHLIPSESFLQRTDDVRILEPGEEMAVKVITVPKTLKTPRIIAVEPTCMQYMQQGVLSVLVQEIPRSNHAWNFVSFESQQPNQRLAREGSITGALATLDLSEASDRVSNEHVRLLLSRNRILRDAVDATRSRKAHVPGHGEVTLSKFASMGSALCFPFEALVFCTIIFVAIERELGRPLRQKDIESFYGRVRVYGDDIIVPVDFVQPVIAELEANGLKVNARKSFWNGKFRESCGAEYYDGTDVSLVRVRRELPLSRRHAEEVVSTVSLRNQLFHRGYMRSVEYLDNLIGNIIPFPEVEWYLLDGNPVQRTPLLGRHGWGPAGPFRHDRHLQRPLVKGVVVVPQRREDILDDYGALMKWFISRGEEPLEKDHLQYGGRPLSVRIKTRWAPAA